MIKTQTYADVMELVDVADSKSAASDGVGVRVPPSAPQFFIWVSSIGECGTKVHHGKLVRLQPYPPLNQNYYIMRG